MSKVRTIAAWAATVSLLAVWGTASAAPYSLFGWYQRSTGGTLSSLFFKAGAAQGCPGPGYQQPCYSPTQAWVVANNVANDVIAAGPPAYDWNGTTLTQTGLLWASSFIGSNPNGTPVISDKITGLTMNTATSTTTAATYNCVEGTFLAGVGADGCLNVNLGTNGTLETTVTYNVGGDAGCVNRLLNSLPAGDDVSTGNTRGLFNRVAGGGCDATDGGFVQYTVVKDTGGVLILSTGSPIGKCILFGIAPLNACPIDATLASASYFVFVAPGATDTDTDGVPDAIDNCTLVANANQLDTNGDGFGNICDADINNSGTVTTADFGLLRSVLGQAWSRVANGPPPNTTISASDMNGSGTVTTADFGLLRARLGTAPGPSGVAP